MTLEISEDAGGHGVLGSSEGPGGDPEALGEMASSESARGALENSWGAGGQWGAGAMGALSVLGGP